MIDARRHGPLQVLELGAGFGGAAAATANLGHHVIVIERSSVRAAFARRHVWTQRSGELLVLEADFNAVELPRRFDVVAYWSGFGAGNDDAQTALLARIARWLRPGGRAYLDVFDPRWWLAAHGSRRATSGLMQYLTFDAARSRCSITYRPLRGRASAITETIRCYDPQTFEAMVRRAGLSLAVEIDACLGRAPSYCVELETHP